MGLRKARPEDESGLYEVALKTGDAGQDATSSFEDPRLIGEVYVGPYLHLEPRFAFCLDEGGPAGYVLAALDTVAFEESCERQWWPTLRDRYPMDLPRPESDQSMVWTIHHPVNREPKIGRAHV